MKESRSGDQLTINLRAEGFSTYTPKFIFNSDRKRKRKQSFFLKSWSPFSSCLFQPLWKKYGWKWAHLPQFSRVKIKSIWVATTQFLFPRNEKTPQFFPQVQLLHLRAVRRRGRDLPPPIWSRLGGGHRRPGVVDSRNSLGVLIYPPWN